jgi:hypothetical protein
MTTRSTVMAVTAITTTTMEVQPTWRSPTLWARKGIGFIGFVRVD